jgi:hypothetical protein
MKMKKLLLKSLLFAALAAPLSVIAQPFEPGVYFQTGATNVSGMRVSGLGLRAGVNGSVALRPGGRLYFDAELGYCLIGQIARFRENSGSEYLYVREAASFHRIEVSPLLEVHATDWLSFAGGPVLGILLGGRVKTLIDYGVDGALDRSIYRTRLGPYYHTIGFGLQAKAGFRVVDGLWIDLIYEQGLHDIGRWWLGVSRAIPQGLLAGLRWMPFR